MPTLRAATFLTGRKSVFSNGERQQRCCEARPRSMRSRGQGLAARRLAAFGRWHPRCPAAAFGPAIPGVGSLGLPGLHRRWFLGKPVYFPCFAATPIPADISVAQRDKAQRQIAAVEAFRTKADRDDRHGRIAFGQFRHYRVQMLLSTVRQVTAQPGILQPDRAGKRQAPEIQSAINDDRLALREKRHQLRGPYRRRSCVARCARPPGSIPVSMGPGWILVDP